MIRIHVLYTSGVKQTYDLVYKGDLWLTQFLTVAKKDRRILRAFALRESV